MLEVNNTKLQNERKRRSPSLLLWMLIFLNFIVFQFVTIHKLVYYYDITGASIQELLSSTEEEKQDLSQSYILSIPTNTTKLPNLPSIRVIDDGNAAKKNSLYGGKGDKGHLGGFIDLDHHGISPMVWKWMIRSIGVHSLLDVGCGRGISTSWFYDHGIEDVLCLEGSHDAVERSVLPYPERQIIEHDFSRGPYFPTTRTYDAVWCVEFIEHVGRNLQKNYIPAFRKSALLFVSHSNWGGHHHVEVHTDDYWKTKFAMFGFVYSKELTERVRQLAKKEMYTDLTPNGLPINAQHVWLTMMVFINPAVSALPQHAHLFAEVGCFKSKRDSPTQERINRKCDSKKGESTITDPIYEPLELTPQQDDVWFQRITSRVIQKEPDLEREQKAKARLLAAAKNRTSSSSSSSVTSTNGKKKSGNNDDIPEYEILFGNKITPYTDVIRLNEKYTQLYIEGKIEE